jgi:hypothetical protein
MYYYTQAAVAQLWVFYRAERDVKNGEKIGKMVSLGVGSFIRGLEWSLPLL